MTARVAPTTPNRQTNRSRVIATLTAALLASLPTAAATADDPRAVSVESVVLRLLNEADAPAREAGVVATIFVREGQLVRKGELLAQLDDADAALATRAATVELAMAQEKATNDVRVRSAKAARAAAEAELRRSQDSIARFPKSVSQSQLDVERLQVEQMVLEQEQAEQDQKLASLEVKLRQSTLDAARLKLERRRVVAPIDGVVVEVTTRIGEWLEPGQKAMRLVSVARLKAEGFVSAADALAAQPGDAVTLGVAINGRVEQFTGKLVFISPEVDPINDQVRVWAEIDNRAGRLRPGQRAEMAIAPKPSRAATLSSTKTP